MVHSVVLLLLRVRVALDLILHGRAFLPSFQFVYRHPHAPASAQAPTNIDQLVRIWILFVLLTTFRLVFLFPSPRAQTSDLAERPMLPSLRLLFHTPPPQGTLDSYSSTSHVDPEPRSKARLFDQTRNGPMSEIEWCKMDSLLQQAALLIF